MADGYYGEDATVTVEYEEEEDGGYDYNEGGYGDDDEYAAYSDDGNDGSSNYVKIFCSADPSYSLAVRDDQVVLAYDDPNDWQQHWIKEDNEEMYDEYDQPSFCLINRATNEALCGTPEEGQMVWLTQYDAQNVDLSLLWSQSQDMGDGYTAIRLLAAVEYNLDALGGGPDGSIYDGTQINIQQWFEQDNQKWKIWHVE